MERASFAKIFHQVQASFWWWALGALGLCTTVAGSLLAYQTHFQHPRYSYIPADEEWRKYLKEIVEASRLAVDRQPQATESGIWVDVAGAVEKPGVYQFSSASRIQDAVLAAGGFTPQADKAYIHRELNLAQSLFDTSKIYIPIEGESFSLATFQPSQTTNSAVFFINTDSLSRIDELPGIGAVRAESIVSHRPYKDEAELLEKGSIPQSVLDGWRENKIEIVY